VGTSRRKLLAIGLATSILLALPAIASGNHSWGSYHWARSSNPVSLTLVDNVTAAWDSYLDVAQADWDQSAVLAFTQATGSGAKGKTCKAISGQINVCNNTYGNNGWLGVATIWASGSHITQATVKVNDTYFNTASYNTPPWRRLVMCQEVGHTFGLDHQDETFDNANLGTCMDYTNDPDGGPGGASNNDPSNEHPNSHDYNQLLTIYSHLDGGGGGGAPAALPNGTGARDPRAPASWGRAIRDDLYVWVGQGQVIFTHVFWVR
jgi:hypothetical protein